MAPASRHGNVTLAIDVMGGDHAPDATLLGCERARKQFPQLRYNLFGDQEIIQDKLASLPELKKISTITHTSDIIENEAKPSVAIRKGRNSSMALAIKAVRDGKAQGVVSAGNTGALMAFGKLILRMLQGIDRPAIGADMPTKHGYVVMLDLGGNITCDANNLFEFSVMGHAYANAHLGIENPSIGLLNIGTEENKGNEAVQAAASMLRDNDLNLNFYGFVEGNDIGKHVVDVVVTDGFTGNVALKAMEGSANLMSHVLKEKLLSSLFGRLGALIARPALRSYKDHFDPRLNNGAMFLGLNGIVIKSHGSMDEIGFANAIKVALDMAENKINDQIIEHMMQAGHIPPDDDNVDEEENAA